MDLATVLTAVTSSLGLSAATAAWLSRTLVSHRLQKDLETFKSSLERDRASDQAAIEGRIREQVERSLGDLAAQREYDLDARKRLYAAIGPLRFQLLLACRDLAGRVQAHGLGRVYDMSLKGYYGRTSLFRILRPLGLAELVERQIAYADFAVDSGAIDLLRFKGSAFAAFSGGRLVEGHPDVNWNSQVQHIFFDYISRCANVMIAEETEGRERALRFHEFASLLDGKDGTAAFSPFSTIFDGMTPQAKPLLWTRLVVYGHLCNGFVNRTGVVIGFERREYPVAQLLSATEDPTICGNLADTSVAATCFSKAPSEAAGRIPIGRTADLRCSRWTSTVSAVPRSTPRVAGRRVHPGRSCPFVRTPVNTGGSRVDRRLGPRTGREVSGRPISGLDPDLARPLQLRRVRVPRPFPVPVIEDTRGLLPLPHRFAAVSRRQPAVLAPRAAGHLQRTVAVARDAQGTHRGRLPGLRAVSENCHHRPSMRASGPRSRSPSEASG